MTARRPQSRSRACRLACATLAFALALAARPAAAATGRAAFDANLHALASGPHRLAGSAEGSRAAAAYVEQALRDAGVKEIFLQDFPLVMPRVQEATIEVDGRQVALDVVRPNLLQPSVTPPDGLAGDTLYAGHATPEEFPGNLAAGRIVVVEADGAMAWLNAFAYGAAAVIFVYDEQTPAMRLHVNVPANLPRFALTRAAAQKLGLLGPPLRVTLRASCVWEDGRGRNVIGLVRGTRPTVALQPRDALLVAVPLDSDGEILGRAPGAREAANIAAWLALARDFAAHPPARDVIFAAFDGQAQGHVGARHFYGALYRRQSGRRLATFSNDDLLRMNRAETAHMQSVAGVLQQPDLFAPATRARTGHDAAVRLVRNEVSRLAAEVATEVGLMRFRLNALDAAAARGSAAAVAERQALCPGGETMGPFDQREVEDLAWNGVLRMLGRGQGLEAAPLAAARAGRLVRETDERRRTLKHELLATRIRAQYAQAVQVATVQCRRRLAELTTREGELHAAAALAAALGPEHTALRLHLGLNLGDRGTHWGIVHGEDTLGSYGYDIEGEYLGLFQEMTRAWETVAAQAPRFDTRVLSGIYSSRLFAPARFADSTIAARMFACWNVSAMTLHDPLARQGLPGDSLARLDADAFFTQAAELPVCLRAFLERDGLMRDYPYRASAYFEDAEWTGQQLAGLTIRQGDLGDPMRSASVRDAIVAVFPSPGGSRTWDAAAPDAAPAGYSFETRARAGALGVVEMPPLSRLSPWACFAGLFGPAAGATNTAAGTGRYLTDTVTASSLGAASQRLLPAVVLLARMRSITLVGAGYERKAPTLAMAANSTAAFPDNRSLLCENGNVLALFAPRDAEGFKLFNVSGAVVLNNEATKTAYQGCGIPLAPTNGAPILSWLTARDLHTLNAYRLKLLRSSRIDADSLEVLQGRGEDLAQDAASVTNATAAHYHGTLEAAASFARRTHPPLVGVMKDLVSAVVLLLLLTIPFAFALERLLVGTANIYRRLGWFAAFFLATFTLLFLLNPAFKLAATPLIIFLAFAIILLSALVISILMRKLSTEMKRLQGQGTAAHSLDVSRIGTMAAAVAMGISTMRRRPLRTVLTAVTVVLLTFTILTFASFSSEWGAQRTRLGAADDPSAAVMVRHPVWGEIALGTSDTLRGFLADRAPAVNRFWLSPRAEDVLAATASRRDLSVMATCLDSNTTAVVSAAIGLDPEDLRRQGRLRLCFEPAARVDLLASNGLFLTPPVAGQLGLRVEDAGRRTVVLRGEPFLFAGLLTDAFRTHTMTDGSSLLPVDFKTSIGTDIESIGNSSAVESLLGTDSASFIPFEPDRVVLIGAAAAQRMGARLRAVTAYPRDEEGTEAIARDMAVVANLPVYYTYRGGSYRTIFGPLVRASGLKAVLIPLLIGGLIVFATMLGSVADREREIYAFSALGLAPQHVGMLFFAEATVYAVVGGMGGYLLGQGVAAGLSFLAAAGLADVPSMNFSSMNAVVTILIVMAIVMLSTLYPAIKASRSANPGVQRAWRMPAPRGDVLDIKFPFTVSDYDLTGVVSYIEEHFNNCSDTSLGDFTSLSCGVLRQSADDRLGFEARVALAPFDLGIEQRVILLSRPSDIEGIDEIRVLIRRQGGAYGDWRRANRMFLRNLRRQFLLWRTLGEDVAQSYRDRTLSHWDSLPARTEQELLQPYETDGQPG